MSKRYNDLYQIVLNDQTRLDEMMSIYFSADYRLLQRITHVMEIMARNKDEVLVYYYEKMIKGLQEDRTDAYRRNTYRYFQIAIIPEDYDGLLYDIAFQDFMDTSNAIAIRAFAMQTCYNIASPYSELWPELSDALHLCLKDNSPGIKSKSRNLINKLSKYDY